MNQPIIPNYQRHVIFCTGDNCAPETCNEVYETLKSKLRALGIDQKSVRRSQTRCFGVCTGGPIMVVYPEGIWYHHLSNEKVLRIIDEHLIGGKPIQDWVFHEHGR